MSTRYNTGNPIESTDVRDMSDNAKNFDEFSNSMSDSFTDRIGRDRQTIEGSIRKAGFQPASFDFAAGGTLVSGDRNKAVFNPEPSGDNNWYAWQGAFPKIISPNSTPSTSGGLGENAWKPVTNSVLAPTVRESIRRSYAEAGYNPVDGSFEAGGTVTTATDVLLYEADGKAYSWGGALPKTVPVGSAPISSGGIDLNAWTNQGDSLLRNRISASVDTIANLRSINRFSFQRAFVSGYYVPGDGGGGSYWYDPTDTSSSDNGGSVIVGDDGGRWKLIISGNINVLTFGAKRGVSGFDNAPKFNAALTFAASNRAAVYVPAGEYYVSSSIMMPSRGSLIGDPSAWAYSDSGFNMKSLILVNATHSIAAEDPIIDVRGQKQTTLRHLDIDGQSKNVCCVEYGARTDTIGYNNHEFSYNTFRNATYGVRANNAGLIRASYNQFTKLTKIGLYSPSVMSDSTFISNYWNDIGFTSNDTDPYSTNGVAIWLGAHAGNAFIGGKIEFCRVGFTMIGTSWLRVIGMWMDVNSYAHFNALGDPTGTGRNNSISACTITGGAYLDANCSAVRVQRFGYNMSLNISGGSIKAFDQALRDVPANATYGPRLAAVSSTGTGSGEISISGTDMIGCSKQFGVYLDNFSVCVDNSVCDLPNSVSGGSVRNGYKYDAGGGLRGMELRNATSDAEAALYGVNIGSMYRNRSVVQIRLV